MKQIFHESTPLTREDCLIVQVRNQKKFDFPEHFHMEYELNLILDAQGALRVVGDSHQVISDLDLVLTGPNLPHIWEQHQCTNPNVTEYTVQFHRDLFSSELLQRYAFSGIRQLLADAKQGVSFSKEAIVLVQKDISALQKKDGIDALISLMSILHILSNKAHYTLLSSIEFDAQNRHAKQLEMVYTYIEQNFQEKITLEDVASHINMTEITFSRFFKKYTGKTCIEFINDFRLQYAMRLLQQTDYTISEISFMCGFHNQAHFNRLFKLKLQCSPREFIRSASEIRVV